MRDFFGQQELARRNTTLLVALFTAAVIVIVLAVYAAVSVGFLFFDQQAGYRFWDAERFAWTVGITAMVVAAGSSYRTWQLRQGGGAAVAEMMGGVRVPTATDDPLSRRLLNVVEEMAIASGLPVPPVYLLQQPGINAFAAGFGPSDAVVAVTHGAIEMLNRDELQGVVAHEFSHIPNGDTRLKMRLMGLLYGITLISDAGILMMTSRHSSHYSNSRERGVHPAIAGVGFLIFLVGTVGAVFADLIKRAVSRQREFLADAAAVQFTRNPSGIAGALKVIGGFKPGSRIDHSNTSETSHFFFGSALKRRGGEWWATHPPLTERIHRIDPGFRGHIERIDAAGRSAMVLEEAIAAFGGAAPVPPVVAMDERAVMDRVGMPVSETLELGASLLQRLPASLAHAAHDPFSARAIVYALLLSPDRAVRSLQLQALERDADANVFREMLALHSSVASLERSLRIPLLELSMPTLKSLSPDQYIRFRSCTTALIKADQQLSLFEYMLHRMLLRHLAPAFGAVKPVHVRYDVASEIAVDTALILSMIIGQGGHAQPAAVFDAAIGELLAWRADVRFMPEAKDLGAFDRALARAEHASPDIRRRLLQACVTAVTANNAVNGDEFELLRAVSDAMDAPMPPLTGVALQS